MAEGQIFKAATTIIARERDVLEVLMVKRHHAVDFVAGAMVFPGGKVHDGDCDPAWARHARHWDDVPEEERALRIAAIRECFEETGIILGDPGRATAGADMVQARHSIDRRERTFLDYVEEMDIVLDVAALTLFARWLTPPVVPKRFDTFFYLAAAPDAQIALSDGRETVETEWISPTSALALAEAGQREIVLPTRMNLRLLAKSGSLAEAVLAAQTRASRIVLPRIVTRDGVRFLQLDVLDGYGAVEEPLVLGEARAAETVTR